ncbi:MAG TPA: hypothetical protein VI796_00270 [Candidatus Thermoplasmatota archaeon]|nr:hypothetical protein [Candidatus Thermoplasmatota archaeon]
MDPSDILPYFQLLGQVALVVGAAVAAYQLIQLKRQRRDQAALQVLTNLQSAEFREAYARVYELPVGASASEVHEGGVEEPATTIMMTFETLGVLVYNRVVPLDVVDQVIGGFLRESWRRLESYVKWKRQALNAPRWGEWYQWLFEHISANPRRAEGAYETFRGWKP